MGFLSPEDIVADFKVRSGDHVADFGAGHGYFTIALARAVGRDGKVWAVDVQQAALDMVRSRAMAEHLLNIEYVRADLERADASPLPDRFMDLVLMGNLLFQAEDRQAVLHQAWRCLRSGGRLAMIEWSAPDSVRPLAASPAADVAISAGTSPLGAVQPSAGNVSSGIIGPAPAVRIKKADARGLAAQAGFETDREFAAGPHHYGLLFIKK